MSDREYDRDWVGTFETRTADNGLVLGLYSVFSVTFEIDVFDVSTGENRYRFDIRIIFCFMKSLINL